MKVPPSAPFVGIKPYTLADQEIFFERDSETSLLKGMILAHRVVLLYGDSGNGKSSLLNAGLVPYLQKSASDFQPERLRISADLSGFDVETKPLSTPGGAAFQSLLRPNDNVGTTGDSFTVPADALADRLSGALPCSSDARPVKRVLLMFDQFEELYSFAGGRGAFSLGTTGSQGFSKPAPDAAAQQRQVADALSSLLAHDTVGTLPVKFLFIFREEYLAKLLALVPCLNDAVAFRLAPLAPAAFPRIVSGPFSPGMPFEKHPSAKFFLQDAGRIGAAFQRRAAGQGPSILTDIQVFCSELWNDESLRKKLTRDDGLLDNEIKDVLLNYFRKIIDELKELRAVAVALLCEMVTSQKTRNVVSESSLLEKLALESETHAMDSEDDLLRVPAADIKAALGKLQKSRIINESERNGTKFYDLASEALIPWLSQRRGEQIEEIEKRHRDESERLRVRKRLLQTAAVVVCACLGLASWAVVERNNAQHEARRAIASKEQADLEKAGAIYARNQESAKAQEADRRAERALASQHEIQTTLESRGLSKEDAEQATKSLADPLVARLAGHENAVTAVAFSRDGKWIATGSADMKVRLWTSAGKLVSATAASTSVGGVSALTFTPDSQGLITGSSGESVRLFKWPGGSLKQQWSRDRLADTVTWLEFSPNGSLGVCASGGGSVALLKWSDLQTSSTPEKIWPHTRGRAVSAARFSSDGKRVVTSSDDGKVRVFSAEPPYELVRDDLVGNPMDVGAPTRGFRFSPVDSSLVVGGAGLKKLVWWKVGSGQKSLWREGDAAGAYSHTGAVLDIAFQPAGSYFATVATDGLCIIWDSATARSVAQLQTEIHGRIFRCDWNGDLLALAGEDGWLEIWKMATPEKPTRFFCTQAHKGVTWGVRFSPGGDLLMTWSRVPSESVPAPVAKATELDHSANPLASDNTAALWDMKWCEQKGWIAR